MTTVFTAEESVERLRKRPAAQNANATRAVFAPGTFVQPMEIPRLFDYYNYNMGAVDIGDQLSASLPSYHRTRRGG